MKTSSLREDFEEMYRLHSPSVYAFALHLTRNPSEAEDLFQETWLRALNHLTGSFRRESFKAWVLTILANLYRDRCRRLKVRRVLTRTRPGPGLLNGEAGAFHPVLEMPLHGSGDAARTVETRQAVARAVENLPGRQRRVFLLKEVEGLNQEEISSVLGIPLGTVKSLHHRAVRRLRRELAPASP